jgi:tetratricopeptide (TPR) repeat protein
VLLRQERLCETLGRRERQQEIIGELLSLLEPGGAPLTRAEVYVRQGDLNVLLGQFAEAETALTEALRLSRDGSETDLERKALRSMSFLRWHQEQYDKAVAINEQLLALDRRQGNAEAVVGDLVNLCTVLRHLEAYDRVRAYLEEAFERYDSVNPVKQIAVLESAGSLYRGLGDNDKAADYVEQALDLSKRHRFAFQRALHSLRLASLRLEQGKTQKCLQLCEEAVERCRELKYTQGLSKSLLRLGDTLLALGRPAEALPHLREAADLFAQLREQVTEVQVRSKIATACERQQNYGEAEAAWQKVKTLQQELGSPAGTRKALEGLARTARQQDQSALALRYYREALALAQDLDHPAKQGELHNTIGILAWNQERYEDALAHYEEALRLFEKLEDEIHAGLMLNSIGVTLQKLGLQEEAIARLEEALTLHRQTEQKKLEGHALAALGDAHFEMNLLEDARSYYEASLQLRRDLDDRTGEGWMLQRLAGVYAGQGTPGRARNHAEQAAAIAAEVEDEELMRACQRL